MLIQLSRMFYPNWVRNDFFFKGWQYFFHEEVYNLSVLFSCCFLWQMLISGFSLSCLFIDVLLIIAFRKYIAGGMCHSTKNLYKQTAIITGANVGIGKETARGLLQRDCRVILACRDVEKANKVKRELRNEGGEIEVRQLDLSSLESVREFAAGIRKDNQKIHILINNAGVMMCPYTETKEGFELQMGTNHLGHFLLTNLLLPQMKHGEPARIINVSSLAHLRGNLNFDDFNYKNGYNKQTAYGNSKIANVFFTRELSKKLKGSNIQVFSLHPGTVYSNLGRHLMENVFSNYVLPILLKTAGEGAQTTLYCATDAQQHDEMYFSDCAVGWALPQTKDDAVSEKLWALSAELTGFKQ